MSNFKTVVISSGHGKYVSGAVGILNEVTEARRVVNKVAEYLKKLGITVHVFHDDVSKTQTTNVNTIVKYHDSKTRDLDISVHFNASEKTDKPIGTEVLYKTQKDLASKVSERISKDGGFINRGGKLRTNLGFLNNCDKPAILLEICFVDSKADADLYNKNFDKICRGIAEVIANKKLSADNPTNPTPPVTTEKVPTSAPPKYPGVLIKKGSTGSNVKLIQQKLILTADGIFGVNTETAVIKFQKNNSLVADGIVGSKTWEKIFK